MQLQKLKIRILDFLLSQVIKVHYILRLEHHFGVFSTKLFQNVSIYYVWDTFLAKIEQVAKKFSRLLRAPGVPPPPVALAWLPHGAEGAAPSPYSP